jgi:hypothetical protein
LKQNESKTGKKIVTAQNATAALNKKKSLE